MSDEPRVDQYNIRLSALDMAQRAYVVEAAFTKEEILERAESYLAFLMTGKAPKKIEGAALGGQQPDAFPLAAIRDKTGT